MICELVLADIDSLIYQWKGEEVVIGTLIGHALDVLLMHLWTFRGIICTFTGPLASPVCACSAVVSHVGTLTSRSGLVYGHVHQCWYGERRCENPIFSDVFMMN